MFPSTSLIIFAAIIAVCIFVAFVVIITCSKGRRSSSSQYPLTRFGELFRQVSGFNLGHPKDAPIFHARPWFGTHGSNFVGVCTIPKHSMLVLKFNPINFGYELNVLQYPQWEPLTPPLYKPCKLSIGLTDASDIIVPSDQKQILILITGIVGTIKTKEVEEWLDCSNVYFTPAKQGKPQVERDLPQVEDKMTAPLIEAFYTKYIDSWLNINTTYALTHDITATFSKTSFPPTKGVVWSLVYTPSSVDDTIFLVYPNRQHTLHVNSAMYIEIDGKRTYIYQAETNQVAGIHEYEVTSLHTIYVEERFLVKPNENILPFHMYVAHPLDDV